jgi:hypothetical protein
VHAAPAVEHHVLCLQPKRVLLAQLLLLQLAQAR